MIRENEIDILLDKDIKRYMESGAPLTIDFQETKYGAGFYIDNGSRC